MARNSPFEDWKQADSSADERGWNTAAFRGIQVEDSPGAASPPRPPTPADLIPLARPKQRRRDWDRRHPAWRYRVPAAWSARALEVRDAIVGIAQDIGTVTASAVAAAFMDYALHQAERGALAFEARFDPRRVKLALTWEKGEGQGRQLPKRQPRQRRSGSAVYLGYRWSGEVHLRLKRLAQAHHLPLGEVVVACLSHSLAAYRAGDLRLRPQRSDGSIRG